MDNFNANQSFNHTNLELLDFIDDANFDQFIGLIRGGNEDGCGGGFDGIDAFAHDYGVAGGGGVMPPVTGDYFSAGVGEGFVGFENFAPATEDLAAACFGAAARGGDGGGGEEGGDYYDDYWNVDGGEVSSGTTTTTGMTEVAAGEPKRRKADRSKTLVSERRRRGSMKEKLYALRSLVPNITKMDKASIIGDAVSYVQDLQVRSKKLQSEIAGLEASLANDPQQNSHFGGPNGSNPRKPSTKKILMQMDVYQVDEKGYFVRLVCNKGENAAVLLYRALESLTSFIIQSTNLTSSASDKFILTFNLAVSLFWVLIEFYYIMK
ncbi:Transcription factor FER-LIKE IRON DEFICIENCY-INDUCED TRANSCRIPTION FACTOR [Linum perenne]